MNYNTTILLFNLLPIIPLDGSKVLNILLNTIIPFKKSHILTIYISFISVFILIILYYKDINMIMMSILLIIMIRNEYLRSYDRFGFRFIRKKYADIPT